MSGESCTIGSPVITARKNALLNRLIYLSLIKLPIRTSFHGIYLREAAAPPAPDSPPVILFGNHSTWWDAHLVMALNEERWHTDGYVMVEDAQLEHYRFFRRCGAFSVNPRDSRSALESLNYAVGLLTAAPRRSLLIFPQGRILANDARPLKFFKGTGHIVRRVVDQMGACALYPIALRYEFIGEQKPDGFISVGAPLIVRKGAPDWSPDASGLPDVRAVTARLEQALTDELDRLRDDVVAYRFSSFAPLIKGRRSINRLWDAVRGKGQIRRVGDLEE